jgi:hypothetical protein
MEKGCKGLPWITGGGLKEGKEIEGEATEGRLGKGVEARIVEGEFFCVTFYRELDGVEEAFIKDGKLREVGCGAKAVAGNGLSEVFVLGIERDGFSGEVGFKVKGVKGGLVGPCLDGGAAPVVKHVTVGFVGMQQEEDVEVGRLLLVGLEDGNEKRKRINERR